jgi:A/G-specific adenine glycosylase
MIALRATLLDWYARNARALPWRGRRDPYAIWISEVMLQQTRVETVIPYYRRFLRRLPNVRRLAAAPLGEVLKLWEGLGYYARARNLHRAAGQIVLLHGGRFPRNMREIEQLSGVGAYTAGAIASIAFGLDEPVLDGNVRRVLSRLFRVDGRAKSARLDSKLWSLARRLVPPGKAGDFNQALMDLGATLCLPSRPACENCPADKLCLARLRNCQDKLPRKPARRVLPHYDVVAAVIVKRGRVLIDRRKPEALLGGLWEFPGGKVQPRETPPSALAREVREELGIEIEVLRPLATIRHAYSHFRITMQAFLCRHVSGRARPIECDACKWVKIGELEKYPFPKANYAILQTLRGLGAMPKSARACLPRAQRHARADLGMASIS